MVAVSEDDDDDASSASTHTRSIVPARGRPPKRQKRDGSPCNVDKPVTDPTHQSFIMKLFDRSVDLAKYAENTALYPVCRAWMVNQPRSNRLAK